LKYVFDTLKKKVEYIPQNTHVHSLEHVVLYRTIWQVCDSSLLQYILCEQVNTNEINVECTGWMLKNTSVMHSQSGHIIGLWVIYWNDINGTAISKITGKQKSTLVTFDVQVYYCVRLSATNIFIVFFIGQMSNVAWSIDTLVDLYVIRIQK